MGKSGGNDKGLRREEERAVLACDDLVLAGQGEGRQLPCLGYVHFTS